MNARTFYIQTFGCQMNEHDSEILAGMLRNTGYSESDSRNDSDIILINTCSVRDNADKRFFGTLGQLKHLKKNRPELLIGVCGCMMQQKYIIEMIKSKYPWVDLIFGTHNIHELPGLIQNLSDEKRKIISVWDEASDIVEGLPVKRKYRYKSFVNVMYGCNNFCTYCIVPYTRGRERSRGFMDIIKEVRGLVSDGVKEITLLGQNVNSYKDAGCGTKLDFAGLIYRLNDIEGLKRIRFMTSHPKDLSDRLVKAYMECDKLCPHIHLPVQSGSTRILNMMGRKYARDDYLAIVSKLRQAVTDIAITTDIIVGFPGETEDDFCMTLDLVEKVRFDSAFTFLYSVRKGTPAEGFKNHVSEEIKHHRFNRLVETVNRISKEKNSGMTGNIEEVLCEGISKTDPDVQSGRTGGHKLVHFTGEARSEGSIVTVRITGSTTFSLKGELVD